MSYVILFKGRSSVFRRYNLANLLTWSEQFDNPVWVASATITANLTAAPDGNNTADKLAPASATDSAIYHFFPVTTGVVTFSLWLKSTGADRHMQIQLSGSVFHALAAITVTAAWQRFSLTGTVAGDATPTANIGGFGSWTTGNDIYAWGAQVIRGSSPGPYQPRTT